MTIVPFLNKVNSLILNPIIYLLFALSFVYFGYGVIRFLSLDAGDSKKVEARNSMIWGIVGMVVMFSVYGLIRFVLVTFGIDPGEVKYIQL
ncbi:MAG: hypothetical protein WC095_02110 [Candidatus Paceibacterota bacterium]